MARIIGGIGTSHVPTIAMAFDKGKQDDPDWTPLFKGYEPVAKWLAEKKPDVLFFCFNDHATTFFFDHYPTFALGVSDEYPIADEGLGVRKIPTLKGHAGLSRHVARSLVDDEFDLTIFQDLPLDHGLHSPLTMMWPSRPDWPGRVVPLVVNVLQHPLPKPMRCYKLGKAIGKAIRSYPEDLKVAMVGTGGLSHQMIGERAGFNDETVGPRVPRPHRPRPRAPGEDEHRGLRPPGGQRGRRGDHVAHHARRAERGRAQGPPELLPADDDRHGRGALRVKYVFDLERSGRGLRINRFLHALTSSDRRKIFLEDPEEAMQGLTEQEKDMVRRLDWKALQDYGASFFCLEKLARTKGVSNPEMVAAFRGETLEQFLKTRRVPGAR